jgi:DnaJ like chaperone protein
MDASNNPEKARIIQHICQRLGYTQSRTNSGRPQRQHTSTLAEDYALLNVSESATVAEIKRGYRKMMSQHHPDKLIAKGLPDAMIKLATEKTQKVQAAYERIMKQRA